MKLSAVCSCLHPNIRDVEYFFLIMFTIVEANIFEHKVIGMH